MGAAGANLILRRGPGLLAGVVAVLLLLAIGAGSAQATTCTDSWTGAVSSDWFTAGNWSTGSVPTSSTDVCINNSTNNPVIISGLVAAQANTLQLGVGGSGTLEIEGLDNNGASELAELDLQDGGTIGPAGDLKLIGNCQAGACDSGAPASLTNLGTTALTNQGTIESDQGSEATALADYAIYSNLNNQGGSILVDAPLTWSGGAVDNQGTVSMLNGSILTVGCCSNTASLTNDSGGQITNNGGSGYVSVGAGATFTQGAGTMSPSSMTAHPAVIADNSSFVSPAPTVVYSGSTPSAIEARGTVGLSGSLASGQSLLINGVSGCPGETLVTAGSGFTNAGTITLGGTCDSGLKITGGTLSNTGTLTASATGTNITREINGSLTNSGTLAIKGDTAFDQPGAGLTQTGGTTSLAGGAILDTSASGATFQLQGGVLTGGGQTQATAAVINGSVSNSGGNIVPGSTSTAGLMTFDGTYTQGSGGRLTEIVDGPGGPSGVGTGYSQLGATGNMTLGGTLTISTLANPTLGDLDTILATNGSLNGTFSTVTGASPPGLTFRYRAKYGSNYAALQVAPLIHATTTRLSSSRNPAKVGRRVTYTATVSPHPGGGTVRFTSGGRTIPGCGARAVKAATGKATCSVTYHSTGPRRIRAAYSGSGRYGRSISTKLTERITRR